VALFPLWCLVCGVVGAAIGGDKKRVFAGFMAGFFLGPPGWLLIKLGPDYTRRCPLCRAELLDAVPMCRYCEDDFRARFSVTQVQRGPLGPPAAPARR
jgi:hypothetical protein